MRERWQIWSGMGADAFDLDGVGWTQIGEGRGRRGRSGRGGGGGMRSGCGWWQRWQIWVGVKVGVISELGKVWRWHWIYAGRGVERRVKGAMGWGDRGGGGHGSSIGFHRRGRGDSPLENWARRTWEEGEQAARAKATNVGGGGMHGHSRAGGGSHTPRLKERRPTSPVETGHAGQKGLLGKRSYRGWGERRTQSLSINNNME